MKTQSLGKNFSNLWIVWKARNAFIFSRKDFDRNKAVDNSKILSWKIPQTKSCDLWAVFIF